MAKDDDIKHVMRSEQRRGRRPFDAEEAERQRRLQSELLNAVHDGDMAAVKKVLADFGIAEGSERYIRAMRAISEHLRGS